MDGFGKFEGSNGLKLSFNQGLLSDFLQFKSCFNHRKIFEELRLVFFQPMSVTLSKMDGFGKFEGLNRLKSSFSQGLLSDFLQFKSCFNHKMIFEELRLVFFQPMSVTLSKTDGFWKFESLNWLKLSLSQGLLSIFLQFKSWVNHQMIFEEFLLVFFWPMSVTQM